MNGIGCTPMVASAPANHPLMPASIRSSCRARLLHQFADRMLVERATTRDFFCAPTQVQQLGRRVLVPGYFYRLGSFRRFPARAAVLQFMTLLRSFLAGETLI
jgi:hypothetical protein